jgi:hypothetical protein
VLIIKPINQYLRDKLERKGYIKNHGGKEKDVNITSIHKSGRAKHYYINEYVLFDYYYNEGVQSDDKDYQEYYRRKKREDQRRNKAK